jgi:murein DD-endopeptidase MepM/ murein hydrolase activator NlpD
MNRRVFSLALILLLFSAIPSLADTSVTKQPASLDSWFGSVYYQAGQHDAKLVVGGWADTYYTLLKFDVSSLPANATSAVIALYSIPKGDSSTPIAVYVDMVTSPWDQATGWMTKPAFVPYSLVSKVPAPNSWYQLDITGIYDKWKSGAAPNYGIQIRPVATNNNFDHFHSSNYTVDLSLRPKLTVTSSSCTSIGSSGSACGPPPAPVTIYYQPTPFNAQDIWFASSFGQTRRNDEKLQVGGWGDMYESLIKFDLPGLPKKANSALLFLLPFQKPDGGAPVGMNINVVTSTWDKNSGAYNHTNPSSTSLLTQGPPTPNNAYHIDITTAYNAWQQTPASNYGLKLSPTSTNNQFSWFHSANYSYSPARPYLQITAVPSVTLPTLKLPVPGGKSWMVTTQAGGLDCARAGTDPNHTGLNYYAIDIAPVTQDGGFQSNVPVYASASGYVAETGSCSTTCPPNGNYVVINHTGGVAQRFPGLITFYLHLRDAPLVAQGQWVNQGDKLGYVGSTGDSTGPHIHFELQYNQLATDDLSMVFVEGMTMKQYQTECDTPTHRIDYYPSSNTHF